MCVVDCNYEISMRKYFLFFFFSARRVVFGVALIGVPPQNKSHNIAPSGQQRRYLGPSAGFGAAGLKGRLKGVVTELL